MKTKELIEQLNELDPSGECDVVSGSSPIICVIRNPGFYDGCFWSMENKEDKVKSIKLNSETPKIVFWSEDFSDLIWKIIELNGLRNKEDVLKLITSDSEYSQRHLDRMMEEIEKEIEDAIDYFIKKDRNGI